MMIPAETDATSAETPLPATWIQGTSKSAPDHYGQKKYMLVPGEQLVELTDRQQQQLLNFLRAQSDEVNDEPKLIVNVIGNAKPSPLPDEGFKSILKSFLRMTSDTWLLTDSKGTYLNDVIGIATAEVAAHHNQVINVECNVRVTCVAFEQCIGGSMEEIHDTCQKVTSKSCATHLVGVSGDAFPASQWKRSFFRWMKVPKVNLLFGGVAETAEHLAADLIQGIPCVVVEESGGLASLIASSLPFLQASALPLTKGALEVMLPDSESYLATESCVRENKPSEKSLAEGQARDHLRKCFDSCNHILLCDDVKNVKACIQYLILRQHWKSGAVSERQSSAFLSSFLQLCQSWQCPSLAIEAVGNSYVHGDVIRKALLTSLGAGDAQFVFLLDKVHLAGLRLIRRSHIRDLYHLDPIMKRNTKELISNKTFAPTGLQQITGEIQSVFYFNDDGSEERRENVGGERPFEVDFHLFLWSLLYHHFELARFFWRRCEFPIATALIASSFLKAAAKLHRGRSGTTDERLEEATLYEQWASQLLSKCDARSHLRTKFLLVRNLPSRGNMSCLQLATKDDEHASFLTNPVCMRHLDDIWLRCSRRGVKSFAYFYALSLSLVIGFIAAALVFSGPYRAAAAGGSIVSFLLAFLLLWKQKSKFHRVPYKDFRAIVNQDSEQDLDFLKNMTQQEANALLGVGIPADLAYEQIHRQTTDGPSLADLRSNVLLLMDTPQMKFFFQVCAICCYLLIFAYLILSASPNFAESSPTPSEWILILCWISFVVHEVRLCSQGDVEKRVTRQDEWNCSVKLREYTSSHWNKYDLLLVVYLLHMMIWRVGYLFSLNSGADIFPRMRYVNSTLSPTSLRNSSIATVIVLNLYSMYFVFWCLRSLRFFAVSHRMGPKMIMIRLMVRDAVRLFLYVWIFCLAYAVWRQVSIGTVSKGFFSACKKDTANYSAPINRLVASRWTDALFFLNDLLIQPFWHLLGDFSLEDRLRGRGNETVDAYSYHATTVFFTEPLMRGVYMLITFIMLLNLMIAVFQYSIDKVQEQADRNWNIYRKAVIFQYHNSPILPAPCSLVLDLASILSWLFRKIIGVQKSVQVEEKSKRLLFSTLRISIPEDIGARSEQNPFVEWFDFIRKWEKTLQNRHSAVGVVNLTFWSGNDQTRTGAANRDPTTASTDSLLLDQLKHDIARLKMDIIKLSGQRDSVSLTPVTSPKAVPSEIFSLDGFLS